MSRKASLFKSVLPAPKTLSQYWVLIPEISSATLLVESATYPTEEFGEVAVWIKGQPVYFPTKSKVPGTWECIIPENAVSTTQVSIDTLRSINCGDGNYVILTDIIIALTIGETMIPSPTTIRQLKSCFLLSVAPVQLAADNPMTVLKWKLTFRYNYIQPLLKWPY